MNPISLPPSGTPLSNDQARHIGQQFMSTLFTQFAQTMLQGVMEDSYDMEMYASLLAEPLGEKIAQSPMAAHMVDLVAAKMGGQQPPVGRGIQAYETAAAQQYNPHPMEEDHDTIIFI
jgi:hypothetical protein